MAHNITIREDGTIEMFSGQNIVPWHGIGQVVPGMLTAKQAIEAAKLGWLVAKVPVYVNGKEVEDYKAVTRQDNGLVLSILGNRYTPIQNGDAFDFFDEVIGSGQAVYDTAGSLGGGKRVWIMAKLKGDLFIDTRPDDKTEKNVLLVTSHDGSAALSMQLVQTRCVCANTLSIAMKEARNQIKIRHTTNYKAKVDEAAKVLKLCNAYFDDLATVMKHLDMQPMTQDGMQKFAEELVPIADGDKDKATRTINIQTSIATLFTRGKGNLGKSRLDALNAVTEFVDHNRSTRTKGETSEAENRFASSMFGSGAILKQRAFDILNA